MVVNIQNSSIFNYFTTFYYFLFLKLLTLLAFMVEILYNDELKYIFSQLPLVTSFW